MIVEKLKEIFVKIMDEELTINFYPFSSLLSAVQIDLIVHLPNTFTELK